MKGSRLRYRKIYGNGPETGWISCSDKNDKNDDLVIQKKHISLSELPLIAYDYDLPPFFGRGARGGGGSCGRYPFWSLGVGQIDLR